MNILRSLLTRLSGSGRYATGKWSSTLVDAAEGPARFDAMWDEVLINSMHCENARMFLDRMGSRWK